MRNEGKTREQIVIELSELREQVRRLDARDKECKRTEANLRHKENVYRTLVETLTYGIQENDNNGVITFSNSAHSKILGYSDGELIGRYIWDFYETEEDRERVKSYLEMLVRDQPEPVLFTGRNIRKDGRIIDVKIDWNYKRDEDQNLIGFISVITDITEQKQKERLLKIMNSAIYSSINAIALADLSGTLTYVNPTFMKMWGYSNESEVLGRQAIHFWNEEDKAQEVVDALFHYGAWEGELTARKKDGSVFIVQLSANMVKDDMAQPICMMASFIDITDRKSAEEVRNKLQAQLLYSQKMEAIGRMSGGIAHDFNNVLTAIKNFSEVGIKRFDQNDPQACDIFKSIRDVSYRAINLTKQLLTFSQKKSIKRRSIRLNEVIFELLKMLRRLIGENITIKTELDPKLWMFVGDSSNIEQIITNLSVNARDAMPRGGTIIIRTENVTIDHKEYRDIPISRCGRFVRLTVLDTGRGISRKHIEHIFEPFYTTKKRMSSSGLGLSVVHGIVESHKGWINVKSERGKGTAFEIYFPAGIIESDNDTSRTPLLKELKGRGERILLIEDNDLVRKSTMMYLIDEGYTIIEAASATDALDIYREEGGNFDLVISDFVLPDKDGLYIVTNMMMENPRLRAILFSGYIDKKIDLSVLEKKGIRFLSKPFDMDDMLKMIKEELSQR